MSEALSAATLFDNQNPLMNPPALPYGVPAFDQIKTEHFMPAVLWGIAKAKEEHLALRDNPAEPTFENTIEGLEFLARDVSRIGRVFSTFSSANNSEDLRKIEEQVRVECSRFSSGLMTDQALYARVKAVYEQRDILDLNEEQKTLLEETNKAFIYNGVHLDQDKKDRLKIVKEQLTSLTTRYQNNDTQATEAYKRVVIDEIDLSGVPERAKNLYQAQAREAGYSFGEYLILLEPFPSDILTHCKNRELREEIYKASRLTCCKDAFDNTEILLDIVKLRHERANLVGFSTYADFALSERMAGSTKTVVNFLEKNCAIYKRAAEADLQALRDLAMKRDGLADFKAWDMSYYQRLLKEENFNFETEKLRPYFDLEKVLKGLHLHAEKLFDIEFKQETTGRYPAYHPDVKTYDVIDKKTQKLIGLLYADYYARPGVKNGGAWMSAIRNHSIENGITEIPLITNNCNFAKPIDGKPTLLSIGDVETVFHEFGHALHGLLSETRYESLAGTNVKRDFVELPSQLMENWVTEPDVLATFAHHHETGEALPQELVQKLKDSQNFCAGSAGLRQTFFSLLDMAYYTADPATLESAEQLEKSVSDRVLLLPPVYGMMSPHFTHIFSGGYAAGYYNYKWAEVLEADVFSAFKKQGLYDKELGERLRATIYSKGGSVDPMKLYVQMMGRQPDPDALFKREGLLAPERPTTEITPPNNEAPKCK